MDNDVVGIDEVGRGSWAGPLVAAAVVLTSPIHGLTDSKILTKSQRVTLAQKIMSRTDYGIGWVSPREIDSQGLTAAVALAMSRAMTQLKLPYKQIIIDGNYNYLPDHQNVKTLVKADLLIPCVSAASIVAKVARDAYMTQQAKLFPDYGFETHVGYGTAKHRLALQQFGVCKLHRLSYKPIRLLIV